MNQNNGNGPATTTAGIVAATENHNGGSPNADSNAPAGGAANSAAQQPGDAIASDPLLEERQKIEFRSRWDGIQRSFVDEPRKAVEQADSLVADAIQQLARIFADERSKLERRWSGGDQVSTDDLRLTLQHYRSFFRRLLEL